MLPAEGDLTADEVIPREVSIGHLEPEHEIPALRLVRCRLTGVEHAALAVIPRCATLGLRELASLLELLLGAVARVGIPGVAKPRCDVRIDLQPLGLAVGTVRTTDLGALIPRETEPAQCLEERVVGLLAVTSGVGVLDAKDEGALHVTRIGPVEQRRADHPDMGISRWRWAKAHPYPLSRPDGPCVISHGQPPDSSTSPHLRSLRTLHRLP